MRYPSDILVITLQLKLHNCFIGTVIIFPFACWSSPLLMGSGVGDSAIALDVLFFFFFTTFMSLTFGDSSSNLSLDMNGDRCGYLPVEITVLKFMLTFKVN